MSDRPWSSFFLSSGSDRPRLRIGIALDPDLTLTAAQRSVLDDIQSSDFADIVLAVVSDPTTRPPGPEWAWRAYLAIDRRRTRLGDDPAVRRPAGSSLDGVAVVEAAPSPQALDVLVDLTTAGVDPSGADRAAHGIWRLVTVVDLRSGSTRVSLESQTKVDPAGVPIAVGVFALDPLVVGPSLARAAFGSTHMVIQKLRQLHQSGFVAARDQGDTAPNDEARAPTGRSPTPWEIVRWIGPIVAGKVAARIRRAAMRQADLQHWRIALRVGQDTPDLAVAPDMTGFEWVESPRGHAYADPFLIVREGRTWLFFEDFVRSERRGVLACAEVSRDGRLGPSTAILESEGHLSYPYVFFDGDQAFMIPESGGDGVVRLYRATHFPLGWEPVAELYHDAAVDTSVWQQDDRWWFFTTLREPRGGASMLMLFSSESLTGEWDSHPMNPISLDVRDARGAGHIYRRDGRLIRPSQDCSVTYGYSFSLNEILTLSRTGYAERRLVTLDPSWSRGLAATHTYTRAGPIEATDGRIPRAVAEAM